MEILTLGEKIKRRRKELEMTLKDLAGDRITPGQISLVESGRSNPSMDLLEYLANALQTSVEYLMESEETQAEKICVYYEQMAETYILNQDYISAEKYIENALYYAEKYDLEYRKAKNLFLRANICKAKNELVLAQQLYLSANVIFIKRNNFEQVINTFLNLGKITLSLKAYHSATSYLKQAEKVYLDNNIGNDSLLGEIYYEMAESYFKIDDIKKAIDYTFLAKQKFEQVQHREEYGKALLLLSQEYNKKGDLVNAIKYSKKTLEVYRELEEEKNITVNITGVYKDNVDKVDLDKTKVVVSGPRSSVDSVKYVQATFDANKESVDTKSTELELKALDSEMNEVDHVTLEFNKVTAKVSYFQQKQVKINPIFSSNESNLVQDQDFTIIPSEINIKGKSDVINNIDSINTKIINVDELGTNNKIVDLDIPDGINADKDSVTIKLINKNKTKNSTFIYSGDDISLLNNEEDVSINDFEIPDDIIVKIQYDNDSDRISKNDLKLYLDLSEGIVSGTRYAITHNDINVKSITIEPSYITAK